MKRNKNTSALRSSWPWWRWVFACLSTLGLALSSYLGWHYLAGGAVIGCGGGSPCDQVLNSRWSSVGGVLPVSGLAAGAYLALLAAGLYIGSATEAPVRRLAWRSMLVLVGAIAGSAVWFIIVQKWIIGSFCPYCMVAHINGLLLAALVIWQAPGQGAGAPTGSEPAKSPPTSVVPPRIVARLPAIGHASVGVVLAGILAICQTTLTPPPEYRAGESKETLPVINPRTAPLVGSPDATHVVKLLFDYKCSHCQKIHFMLEEAIRRYGGKLAFVLCPTPLNSQCNPYIPRDVDEFKNSCELAKIALAVWVARRELFPDFDQWMFSLESGDFWRPRSPDAARAKAIELVGQAPLDAALADPWIDRYLQACIQIYGSTSQGGNNAVPKLVFGPRWVIPQPNDADDLVFILRDSLGVPMPASEQP